MTTVFEQVLASFVNVAKHNVNPIVECLYEWRQHFDFKFPNSVRERMYV